MGIFKKLALKTTGAEAIKDYGIFDERQDKIFKFKHSASLIQKKDKRTLIIEESAKSLLYWHYRWFEFDRAAVQKLRDILDDALKLM